MVNENLVLSSDGVDKKNFSFSPLQLLADTYCSKLYVWGHHGSPAVQSTKNDQSKYSEVSNGLSRTSNLVQGRRSS